MVETLLKELEETENPENIIKLIDEIISIKPEIKEKLLLKKALAYKNLENYEKAIKYYKEFEKYSPADEKYMLLLEIADCYENLEENEKEMEYLIKSFNLHPTDYSHKKIIVTYYLNHEYRKCISFIENLKEKNLADIEDLINLTYCYNHCNDPKNAISCAEQVIELDPKNIDMYITLTISYESLGDMEKLMETYRKIVELDVDEDEQSLLIISQAYMGLEEEEKSFETIDKAIKLNPYDPMTIL